MTRRPYRARRHARGQAMTELVVAAAVLVPLLLLVSVIAKYGHVRQMTQQAARNAAWEATVAPNYRTDAAQQSRIRARMLDRSFATADAPIRTATSNATRGRFDDRMLNTFSGQALLERDDVRLSAYRDRASPGVMDRFTSAIGALAPGFPPNRDGYVTAEVEMRLRDLRTADGRPARYLDPMDRIGLVMRGRQTLLADAWNASGPLNGPRSVKSQLDGKLALTSHFSGLTPLLDTIGALPLPILGKLDELDIGTIEPDIVPADRLKNAPRARP